MIEVIRATELHQRAGAYYVRIEAMMKKYGFGIDVEFDENDTPDTKYIVVTDNGFPVATCRILENDGKTASIGRVVVLEAYRKKGIGSKMVTKAENWLREMNFKSVYINSRTVATGFYEKLGYKIVTGEVFGDTFECVRMEKEL